MRRKRKSTRKTSSQDDKKLQTTLKRLNAQSIPGIEEVNFFREDGNVIHFENPKVQASIAAHTYVVSGKSETKRMEELLPGILNQLGQNSLQNLQRLLSSYQASHESKTSTQSADAEDQEDVPDLVEDFEAQADDENLE